MKPSEERRHGKEVAEKLNRLENGAETKKQDRDGRESEKHSDYEQQERESALKAKLERSRLEIEKALRKGEIMRKGSDGSCKQHSRTSAGKQ